MVLIRHLLTVHICTMHMEICLQASLCPAHHHRRETAACWTVEDNSRRHRLRIHKSLQCVLNSSKYAAHDIYYILKLHF